MEEKVSVKQFGAAGNGVADDAAAIQAALDSGAREVWLPTGNYRVTQTLRVPSHTTVHAAATARVYLCGARRKQRGEFLLTNSDHENGNEDIALVGGIWDGNHKGRGNAKPDDIFDEQGYSGALLNFYNVKGLRLEGLTAANSTTYYVRMGCIDGFTIEDVSFLSDELGWNQDGLHFGGECRHGTVRRVRALSNGQTNDDLLALNADDCVTRVENRDLLRGAIEDVLFEDIFAEDCHTVIRLLSDTAAIRNVTFRNIYAGFRCYAVNMDAARYCRTPIFKEDERPQGAGHIENVVIENMVCYPTRERIETAIALESHAKGLRLEGFTLLNRRRLEQPCPALRARNVPGMTLCADGQTHTLRDKTDSLTIADFTALTVDSETLA